MSTTNKTDGGTVKGDATQVDTSPSSTWGASEAAKAQWDREFGPAAREASEADTTAQHRVAEA